MLRCVVVIIDSVRVRIVVDVVEVVDVVVVVSISWGADVSTVSSEAQETNIMTRIKDISFFLIAYKNTTILIY